MQGLVPAAADVTFSKILSIFFISLIPDTILMLSLFPLSSDTAFLSRCCASLSGILLFVSVSPASYCVHPVSFPAYVYTAQAGVDDCWGRVHTGSSLETGVHHFIMAVSMATIESCTATYTKDTPM